LFAKLPDIEQMNGMTNIAEYGKSPMRDIQNLYFLPLAKKVLTLYSQKTSETAFFTVMSGIIQMPFQRTFSTLNRQRIS